MYTKINKVPEQIFCSANLSIVRYTFLRINWKIYGSFGSTRVSLKRAVITFCFTAVVFIRLFIIIFTRWSCLCPCAREIISRGGRIPTTRSRSSSTSVHACDVANDDRCVDGTGVGGYGSYRRRGRCVLKQVALLLWVLTTFYTLYTHKVPFSWIYFFSFFLGRKHNHQITEWSFTSNYKFPSVL